jgi:cysteine desulfurase
MSTRVYLDHQATTPTDPRVVEAMAPWWTERCGNASSDHVHGWEAKEAVERAAGEVAALVGCRPREVVFTSGATESNNLALRGVLAHERNRGRHLVISAVEHPSVRDCARRLEAEGAALTLVPVDGGGVVDPAAVEKALREDTVLCSVQWANNEIGTLQPMEEIGALCRERGVLFHTDAVQAVGKVPVDASRCDLLSLSGHKMHGPKGVGALVVRRRAPRVRLTPLLAGGSQQGGVRPGTLPVPLLVGLGEASRLAAAEMGDEAPRLARLRDRLVAGILDALPDVVINGDPGRRLPGNTNLRFMGVEAEALLLEAPGLAASPGSACASESHEPSHVLLALGLGPEEAHCSLRLGVGRFTTESEIDAAVEMIVRAARRLRRFTRPEAAAPGRGEAG